MSDVRSKKKGNIIILLLLLLLASSLSIFYYHKPSENIYKETKVYQGSVEVKVLATGTVNPENRLDIKPPVGGRIDKIVIDEGQSVKKGEILAWMSSTERAALIDSARSHGKEELKKWEDLYRPIPILAPVHGVIIVRKVDSGQVFSGGDTLYTMSDRLIVRAQLDETDIAQIQLQQKADIVLDAYPEEKVTGKVILIAFDAKTVNNVTTYDVNVLPEFIPKFMRSGMTANVSFHVESKKRVLLIPSDALHVREGRYYVMTKDSTQKTSVEKEVDIGVQNGKETEILSGLHEGETVLTPQNSKRKMMNKSPFSPMGTPRKHP
jgi:macrolide-specific efflux system membrane fusion protein